MTPADRHRAAIRAMPRGLVPLEVLLASVREDVSTGLTPRAYVHASTERDETTTASSTRREWLGVRR